MTRFLASLLVCALGGCASSLGTNTPGGSVTGEHPTRLGNFSVSLAVKDLSVSRAFYAKRHCIEAGRIR